MKVSLVVTTLGRGAELRRFVDSLAAQTYRNFELIVVDQNEDDRVPAALTGCGVPCLRLRSPRGASVGRNTGLAEATGDVIAFPDDDCTYEPDTLEQVVKFLSAGPEYGGVIGKWKSDRREDVGRYRVLFQAGTCFWFLRREWAVRIGNFDETLGPGPAAACPGGEDSDYLIRGLDLGMRLRREPAIVIRHPEMPTGAMSAEKVAGYGFARMVLLAKHRYPLWFRLANLALPLVRLLRHPFGIRYCLNMFKGRFRGLSAQY